MLSFELYVDFRMANGIYTQNCSRNSRVPQWQLLTGMRKKYRLDQKILETRMHSFNSKPWLFSHLYFQTRKSFKYWRLQMIRHWIWKGFSSVLNNFLVFYFLSCLVSIRMLVSKVGLNIGLCFQSIILKCKTPGCFNNSYNQQSQTSTKASLILPQSKKTLSFWNIF